MIGIAEDIGSPPDEKVEEVSDLAKRMEHLFSEKGALSTSPQFEYRPEQQTMAVEVANALIERRAVIMEAGTGVGKSLAYLLPSITYALERKQIALISTHTINLQEQLIDKDIPIAQKALDVEFKAVLMKGRHNFLCPQRLKRVLHDTGDLFSQGENKEIEELYRWSRTTEDGSLSSLDFQPSHKVWTQVCSETNICTSRTCKPENCYYQAMRKEAEKANVIVLNHTLFFTLLAANEDQVTPEGEEPGFLFPNDFVVFDEAHTMEDVAARFLGLRVSQVGMKFDIQRLYNPNNRKGLFRLAQSSEGIEETEVLLEQVDSFFDMVEACSNFRDAGRQYRVRESGIVDNNLTTDLIKVEKRAMAAAEAAISNPQLDETSMAGSQGLLISITGGKDMTLFEVDEAATRIREEVDADANIKYVEYVGEVAE